MSRSQAARHPVAPRPPLPGEQDEWTDRAFLDADLSNTVLRGADVRRCTFTRCRMTGFQLPEGSLTDARFVDCRLDLGALRFARLERVAFEGCMLRELDLVESRLQDVLFSGCDLRQAEFGGTRASRLELRGCEVEGLGGVDGLRGALFAWPDAMGLLGPLLAGAGIVVLEDEE